MKNFISLFRSSRVSAVALTLITAVSLVTHRDALAAAVDPQLERGIQAVQSMAGCYLVDYSYTETESLLPGYERDTRVYDVNTNKTIKEWIFTERVSTTRIRLQHVLFGVDLSGKYMDGSVLKHTGEDWEYSAPYVYDFVSPLHWDVKALAANNGQWTRRVTNLDDGLRYQCASSWSMDTAAPEWSCDGYAPIPGRETRDMGRKDYNTLQRHTRVVAYGQNWLERQDNIKTIDQTSGNGRVRTPLAHELGKNWYVRLPDSECAPVRSFVNERTAFWSLLRETWDEVLTGDRAFVEKTMPGQPSRYARVVDLEEASVTQNLNDAAQRTSIKASIRKIIDDFRAP